MRSFEVVFYFLGDKTMDCEFVCMYKDESAEECEAIQGECIGDLCEEWKDCEACDRRNECVNARV